MRAAITLVSAAVLVGGCSTIEAGNGAHPRSLPVPSLAPVAIAAAPTAAGARGDHSGGGVVTARPAAPADPDGNPACPTVDAWGASGGRTGVAVSYWGHGADYVTVLVRTTEGPDVARSVAVQAGQALQLFEFPDTSPAAVEEVLIITNDTRCYATADPAMRRR